MHAVLSHYRNSAPHVDWRKLKAMGVKLIRTDNPPTITPYPTKSNVDLTLSKNNEVHNGQIEINDNELPSNIMDVEAITPKVAPNRSEKTEHITSNVSILSCQKQLSYLYFIHAYNRRSDG